MSEQYVLFRGAEMLTLRQLDRRNGLAKGSSFRAFKRLRGTLEEGRDFFWLEAGEHAGLIADLRARGQIYATTVNLVLLAPRALQRLERELALRSDPPS